MSKKLYLRQDVYFEPLFNNWYMWPYLLAPAQAAMNLANHHLKLMSSFVSNAKLHAQAAKLESMVGSSLVDCKEDQVEQVKELIQSTKQKYGDLFEFAKALKELDDLLFTQAKGESLAPLYKEIPAVLKGYVELVYDLNNQPAYRLIEGLLYKSPFYKKNAQSLCFGKLPSEQRPFVLSTPRLPDAHHLHVACPLNHPFCETLLKMRDQACDEAELYELATTVQFSGGLSLADIVTEEIPQSAPAYSGSEVKISYLGHAGVMVQTDDICVLVDPVIAYENDKGDNKLTFKDIPEKIDYIMVTHTHMDHVCIETLLQLKHKVNAILVPKNNGGSLADPSIKLMLQNVGFKNVIEMEDMEVLMHGVTEITALPFLGEHADVNVRSKAAWFIKSKNKKIVFAADSSNIDEHLYDHILNYTGEIDVLFIGMECKGGPLKWLYGPLLTRPISNEANQSRRFNGSGYEEAIAIVQKFNAKSVYVYALGMEPWYKYFMGIAYSDDDDQMQQSKQLVNECLAQGRKAERLFGKKEIYL
jgi:L-ascorbate metabolism protein UlaG (beta-lactamase superfamily)